MSGKTKIFSIIAGLYIIGLVVMGILHDPFFLDMFNGIFIFGSLWGMYFLSGRRKNKENCDDDIIVSRENGEGNVSGHVSSSPPDMGEDIYVGEEITREDFERLKDERRTWYAKTNRMIMDDMSEMKQFLDDEEGS